MIKAFLLILSFSFSVFVSAQFTRHIVRFKDKGGTPHSIANPATYLSAKSIARRTKYNISIDSTDLPITPRYLDSIRAVPGVTILNYSKWLNQVAILIANSNALVKINSFPFVLSTNPIALRQSSIITSIHQNKLTIQEQPVDLSTARVQLNYGNSFNQINIHNGQYLHDKGMLGNGISIALMDAGFNSYLTNTGTDSLIINNQIKETYDFVANETSVNEDNSHGFYCLSIIGANKPGVMIGSAPKANFYLYRTEDVASEYPIEEQNWIVAAERADSIGVDMFSTSLGYIDFDDASFDYGYPQRNGNTAMMTRAADLAAKKGILVLNSAGNNGNGSGSFTNYQYVSIPADGDSVVAVGSCTSAGIIASSSAWGPAFGGRIKPNITSLGQGASFINLGGTPSNGNGTSFSCPNMAGLMANLWQALPELSNMKILDITQRASHIFAAPDGRYGYGIPNMKKAFVIGLQTIYTAMPTINQCAVEIPFSTKDFAQGSYVLERKLVGASTFDSVRNLMASNAPYALKLYNFKDTIPGNNFGTVNYRIKHKLGTDTAFYYNESTVNFNTACTTTGIIPVNTFDVKVSPNPFTRQLNINMGSLISNKIKTRIFSENGKLVYNQLSAQRNIQINTASWLSGIYTIEIWNGNEKVFVKRIVK
jgi:serine protease AprX